MAKGLLEIRLPEGDVPGFDVGRRLDNGGRLYDPATWLAQGYRGVRFIGRGRGRTRIRPAPGVWTNLFVAEHQGTVRFESLSIHGRGRSALMAGEPDSVAPLSRRFRLEVEDFELVAEDPAAGQVSSVCWGIFTYRADLLLRHGVVWYGRSTEHSVYQHCWADLGSLIEAVEFMESGAQHVKARPDREEVPWPGPRARQVIRRCVFKRTGMPWTSRGSGAIVCEGGASHLTVEDNQFWMPSDTPLHARAIMVDDGSLRGWPQGAQDSPYRNGDVIIRRNLIRADGGPEGYSTVIRVGNLSPGSHRSCRSLTIEGNAIYGRGLQVQTTNIPDGATRIAGNNTPAIREVAAARGLDVSREPILPLPDHALPLSQGLIR